MADRALIASMSCNDSRVRPVSALLANIPSIAGTGECGIASITCVTSECVNSTSEVCQGPGSAAHHCSFFIPSLIDSVLGLSGEFAECSTFARDAVIDLCVSLRGSPFAISARNSLRSSPCSVNSVRSFRAVMGLGAKERVRLGLAINLVGMVASQDLSGLLNSSLVLTEESLCALGAAGTTSNSSQRTVVSL